MEKIVLIGKRIACVLLLPVLHVAVVFVGWMLLLTTVRDNQRFDWGWP